MKTKILDQMNEIFIHSDANEFMDSYCIFLCGIINHQEEKDVAIMRFLNQFSSHWGQFNKFLEKQDDSN